ncbi:hypothetical protein [Sporofaciens sp. SGI.106]|uniref:hypothetical protein n=1 Tax=Sporofaciens sp. SGI.106 TaxID=3420568 RepID=UPI002A957EBA|nr:hypothetical protein [Lachnoclostridium sp.]
MKKIAISISNRVFAESVYLMLKQTGDFHPLYVPPRQQEMILIECQAAGPDILLMDVTPSSLETRLEGRLALIDKMRRELSACKMVLLCDEIAYPELARDVMRAKQAGKIDAFFYASVTAEYLAAALDSL